MVHLPIRQTATENRTCFFCKGVIERKPIDYMSQSGERYALVKDLPADACSQCGEIFLDPDAMRSIDEAWRQISSSSETLEIPVVHSESK